MAVKARIIRIGNSQGVRIPKALLEQSGLSGEVELAAEGGRIVIQPSGTPRGGWESAFASMAERGDDVLLDAEAASLSSWDAEEWQWD